MKVSHLPTAAPHFLLPGSNLSLAFEYSEKSASVGSKWRADEHLQSSKPMQWTRKQTPECLALREQTHAMDTQADISAPGPKAASAKHDPQPHTCLLAVEGLV